MPILANMLPADILPKDWPRGAYAARLMTAEGPSVVGFVDGQAYDLTHGYGTVSRWLEAHDPVAAPSWEEHPYGLCWSHSLG